MAENVTPRGAQPLRNARACEACRAIKTRCFYKNDQTVCQRCEQSGNSCVVRSKARPGRSRTLRNAKSEIPLQNCSFAPDDPADFSINLPTTTFPSSSEDVEALHQHHQRYFEAESGLVEKQEQSSRNSPQFEGPSINAGLLPSMTKQVVTEQRKVTFTEAEQLLLCYRSMATFFPFVIVPANETVISLSRSSPFLLLAILTVASAADAQLHNQIDQEFRRILSAKVIINGQKSLDFLQGILIYIAWYPIHARPKNNQTFMYMSMATSLAVDLGLDRESPNRSNFNGISTDGLFENGVLSKAAKRAYLGCYYLSSALSMGFQKSNNLQYCNLMDTRGESLLSDEDAGDITSLVKLQRLAERISILNSSTQLSMNDMYLNSLGTDRKVQIFQREVQDWRNGMPENIVNLPTIGLAERFVGITMYSYELGFLRRPYRHNPQSVAPSDQSHLTSCLEACKKFFEYLLCVADSLYLSFTTVQWSYVVQAVLVLSRLTFLMAANLRWDAGITRANVPLVMYLDCLCYRFQQLSTSQPSSPSGSTQPPRNPDAMYVFKMMLESVKKSYERRVALINPFPFVGDMVNGNEIPRGRCPILDPSLSVYFRNTELQYPDSYDLDWIGGFNEPLVQDPPLYHDLWATMTSNWAEEM